MIRALATVPTPTTSLKSRSIATVCQDAFVGTTNCFKQFPQATAALKGAALGTACTTTGLVLGIAGPAGWILGGAIGMGLGASVEIDRAGWDSAFARNTTPLNSHGAKFCLAALGAAAGLGVTLLGGSFPVGSTVLAAGVAGAAMGFAYRQMMAP